MILHQTFDDPKVREYITGVAEGAIIPHSNDKLLRSFITNIKISFFSDLETFFTNSRGERLDRISIQNTFGILYDVLTDGQHLLKLFRLESMLFEAELSEIFKNRDLFTKYTDHAAKILEKIAGDSILSAQLGQYILQCMTWINNLFDFTLHNIEQESNQFYYDLTDDLAELIKRMGGEKFDINSYAMSGEDYERLDKHLNDMTYAAYLISCLAFKKKYEKSPVILSVKDTVFRFFIHNTNWHRRAYQTDASFGFDDGLLKIVVKNEIYKFFELIDKFDNVSCIDDDDEELNEFIYAVLDTSDEETLMLLFSKGLLHTEKVDEYIDYLLDSSNTILVPYLISMTGEEDE